MEILGVLVLCALLQTLDAPCGTNQNHDADWQEF